ncbi:MAG: hypothetical protein NZ874_01040 [Fimbriimonadales bacterium]|nr:hypothetical protein [Fimbriimonadales bacterium]
MHRRDYTENKSGACRWQFRNAGRFSWRRRLADGNTRYDGVYAVGSQRQNTAVPSRAQYSGTAEAVAVQTKPTYAGYSRRRSASSAEERLQPCFT